jgi:hypothetical protein
VRRNHTFRPANLSRLESRDVPSTLLPTDWPTYPVGPGGSNYNPASVPILPPPLIGDFVNGNPGLV